MFWTAACVLSIRLKTVRQYSRGPFKTPLKRAGRIIAPIGSSCAARSIEVSEMTTYGAIEPSRFSVRNAY